MAGVKRVWRDTMACRTEVASEWKSRERHTRSCKHDDFLFDDLFS